MTKLLVITSSYPNGLGEAFFEIELRALARRFDRVDILPTTARAATARRLPNTVSNLLPFGSEGHRISEMSCGDRSRRSEW